MIDLYNEIMQKSQDLDKSVRQLRKSADDYANAYRNYRVALAKELLYLKEEGFAITLAGDIARGKEDIADLKLKEIVAEGVYKANLEAINSLKLQIRLLDNQMQREFGGSGVGS